MSRGRILLTGGVLVAGGMLAWRWHITAPAAPSSTRANPPGEPARVVRVIDGDTIEVSEHLQRFEVRLLGIDTPEVVDPRKPVQCFGREASAHTKSLLPAGTDVWLETDPAAGATDKYGRQLDYVWLANHTNINQALIADGYAHEYTYHDTAYKYQTQFRAAEAQAQAAQRGLWSSQTCSGDTARPATG